MLWWGRLHLMMSSPQYYNNEYRSFKGKSSGREWNLEQVKKHFTVLK